MSKSYQRFKDYEIQGIHVKILLDPSGKPSKQTVDRILRYIQGLKQQV